MTDQPDGIESDSFDLPTPANAAKRVAEYLEWWGDGLIDAAGPNVGHPAAPLYARDLQALVNAAWERDLLLWLHAEAVWQRDVEVSELSRWRSGQRHKSMPKVTEVPDGITYAALLLRAQGTEGGDEHDELLRNAGARLAHLSDVSSRLLLERADSEASRQAWAEEAMRLECIAETLLRAVSMNDDRLRFMASRILDPLKHRNRCTGIAADALAWFAVGRRDEPKRDEYPLDESDLAACERTYKMAPEFLRERMLPVLEKYRAAVSRPVCAVHPEPHVRNLEIGADG